MNTTTLITGAGAAVATGIALYDNKNKGIDKGNAKVLVGTAVALTATTIGAGSLNHMTMDEIHRKYSSAYVESMSDEELETALEQMNLLLSEEATDTSVKSL